MAIQKTEIKMQEIKIRITLLTKILGSLPGDEEIFRTYVASKSPRPELVDEEVKAILQENKEANSEDAGEEDDQYVKGVTVFAKDENGDAFLYDYVIKGFFKNACKALRDMPGTRSNGFAAYKSKIDLQVFTFPRQILMHLPENPESEPLEVYERPLRAQTPQGERVALAASETMPAGCWMDITIRTLTEEMMNRVVEWLEYGQLNGLGCWRNSGLGRFSWELIEDNTYADGTLKPKTRGRKKKTEGVE